MTDNIKNLDKKLYRFALFGMSGSGKTCILTAMGMTCRATTDGSYCGSLPAKSDASPEVLEGWENLKKYVKRLKMGEPPRPTEVKQGDYPRYRYVYTDSKMGEAYFEIIDYAGELIHTGNITQEYCTVLLKHLTAHDVDGIIVLVSVPNEEEKQSEIPDEIATIREAFNFLQSEQSETQSDLTEVRRYPIALVLTKWDRQWNQGMPIPPNEANVETERLAQFMKQCTAYQTVRDVLEGGAGNGGFKVFPVSALGKCSDGRKPDIVPLESYGLPFVFGWLIQSANEANFRRFEKMQSELPWWRWQVRTYLPFAPVQKWEQPVHETWSLAQSLLERLPEKEKWEGKRTAIKAARKELLRICMMQVFLAVLVLVSFLAVGTRMSDWRMLAVADTVINDPASTDKDLAKIEKRLVSYVRSSPHLVPFHGRGKAGKNMATDMLGHIHTKYEESVLTQFRAVPIENNDEIQRLGQQYLDRFPNGKAREEVVARMREAEDFIVKIRAENLFIEFANLPIENNESIQVLGGQYLDEFRTGENRAEVIAKMTAAQRLHDETIARQNWEEFVISVRGALEEGNVPSALSSLANRTPKNADWVALCEEILAKTTETVKRRIDTLGTQYDRIKDEVRRSRDAVRDQLSKRVSLNSNPFIFQHF